MFYPKKSKPSLDDIFKDLDHPNPNINKKACSNMVSYWPEASIERLIGNLYQKDLVLRRKSVKALGCFGDSALLPVARLFMDNNDVIVRTSCLKVFVKIAAIEKYDLFPKTLLEVVNLSLKDNNPQISLLVVSLLRQLGKQGLPLLIKNSRDKNILLAKASVTAIGEIVDPSSWNCLRALEDDSSLDDLIRESVIYSLENYKIICDN